MLFVSGYFSICWLAEKLILVKLFQLFNHVLEHFPAKLSAAMWTPIFFLFRNLALRLFEVAKKFIAVKVDPVGAVITLYPLSALIASFLPHAHVAEIVRLNTAVALQAENSVIFNNILLILQLCIAHPALEDLLALL